MTFSNIRDILTPHPLFAITRVISSPAIRLLGVKSLFYEQLWLTNINPSE